MTQSLIEATINLEQTGKTPVAPLIDHFATKYSGVTADEFMKSGDIRLNAILKVHRELGPWDMLFLDETANYNLLRMGVPIDMEIWEDTHQFRENEYLDYTLYESLENQKTLFWMRKLLARKHPDFKGFSGLLKMAKTFQEIKNHTKKIKNTGLTPAVGFVTAGPFFEYACMGRGLENFCFDMYDRRKDIQLAGKRYTRFMTNFSIYLAKYIGTPRIFIGLARSSGSFISPNDFEELVLPDLEYMVKSYVNAGITPLFHCDSDWTDRLHYFRRFPEKKCILELDGTTNIRKAKEILGDRMAIMGDVPCTLLAFGTYEENLKYCKELINDVGSDGGFILSSGCSVPPNAKPENLHAMYQAASGK